LPENAKLQYLLMCDAVGMSPEHKPTFYGLFSVIRSPKFPCVHPAMVIAWGIRARQPCKLSLQLLSPKGDVVHDFDTIPIEAQKECIVGGQHSLTQVEFPGPGEYKFKLIVDGEVLGDVPVLLTEIKTGSSDESES